jgi:hypothetical protein
VVAKESAVKWVTLAGEPLGVVVGEKVQSQLGW